MPPYSCAGEHGRLATIFSAAEPPACLRTRYFFKSDAMHEVPGFTGDLARVVQATFIGYSEDDGEILVWS